MEQHQSIKDFYQRHVTFKTNEEISLDRQSKRDFPDLKNKTMLDLYKKKPISHLPIWIMRQAGRYLPEFQQVRKEHSFFEVCENPYLCALVTLQPILRFKLDSAIIFSDILVIPRAMGFEVTMEEKKGPVFQTYLKDLPDLEKLRLPLENELDYVYNAIYTTRFELEGKVPLIGFCGAAWTLFTYMCEGGSTKMFSEVKKWIFKYPEQSHKVLQMLTDVLKTYMSSQIQAGAQAVQIFDSFAGELGPEHYEIFSYNYTKQLCEFLKEKHPDTMIIVFPKGQHAFLEKVFQDKNIDCVGIDYTMDRKVVKEFAIKYDKIVQGNMDPGVLLGSQELIQQEAKKVIDDFWGVRHIVNLGHGMWPSHKPQSVEIFTDFVREYTTKKMQQK